MSQTNMVINGDCLDVMRGMPENFVDAIVTDPPYALTTTKRWKDTDRFTQNQSDIGKRFSKGFMGKEWDGQIPGVEVWSEALRVCKPGAHMLAFGGTRTHHRLMVAIEDAGWEIRDCLMWLYGSGFPKSLDVSKAIDKMQGVEREVVGEYIHPDGKPRNWEDHNLTKGVILYGHKDGTSRNITAPATPEAQQWDGWGTALKPAWEPIILTRKPLDGTVAENVLKWGTGGINIDGCRIEGESWKAHYATVLAKVKSFTNGETPIIHKKPHNQGRWPANLILDEESAVMLDEQSGENCGAFAPVKKGMSGKSNGIYHDFFEKGDDGKTFRGDSGGASRFFYTAKATSGERNKHLGGLPATITSDGRDKPIDNPYQRGETLRKNHHPTVKPVDLLRYLCQLITPPNGIILDPFAGSGSTGVAAFQEGFDYILIDIDQEYCEIAKMRNAQKRIGEFA